MAKITDTKSGKVLEYDDIMVFGDDVVEKYGLDAVKRAALSQFRVDIAPMVRTMLGTGKETAEIRQAMEAWRPGDKLGGVDAIVAKVGKMSDEEKAAIRKALGL